MQGSTRRRYQRLSTKLALAYSGLIVLVSGTLSIGLFFQLRASQRESFRERLQDIVTLSASQIDGDLHSLVLSPADLTTAPYRVNSQVLQQVGSVSEDIRRLYTVRQNTEGELVYILDLVPERGRPEAFINTPIENVPLLLREGIDDIVEPTTDPSLTTLEEGATILRSYAPIVDELGRLEAILVIELDASALLTSEAQARNLALLIFAITLPLASLIGWILSNQLTAPIVELVDTAEKIGEGDLSQTVAVKSRDEVGILAETFNQMMEQLRVSFNTLEVQVENRTQALSELTERTQQENETLQQEVQDLLGVVLNVEEGNLTVQAEVTPQITGLVADTLNRLIAQLAQVLAQVLQTAQQVNYGSQDLKTLAQQVASFTAQQAEEVNRVLALTEQVKELAQESATTADATNQSLSNVQYALNQGQDAVDNLKAGIETLQFGSNRIVNQVGSLQEFATLAEEFVQEQSQIASVTQMLSMSANLIASRAKEQKDPRQFLSLALEFEAIAKQVGELARQANNGLGPLQQRTAQVQQSVAGINQDIQNLSGLVVEFTTSVDQSTRVFGHVTQVSTELEQSALRVLQSSRSIVDAAQSSATVVGDIADLAHQTAQLTQTTQHQSEAMEAMSQQLLQRIRFFQLPQGELERTNGSTGSSIPTTATEIPDEPALVQS